MTDPEEFIASGILERYVLGEATAAETAEIRLMSGQYPEVEEEILAISLLFERLAIALAVEPDPVIRPFLLAAIDYSDRLKKGEVVTAAPVLSPASDLMDYWPWLSREDMVPPETFEGIFAKIISRTPELVTAVVWLQDMAPAETHNKEYERFLIVEGSCEITIGAVVYQLKAGDYMEIPLHKNHHVQVTSAIPCKVILQRVAA